MPAPHGAFAWLDTVSGFVHVRREDAALCLKPLHSPASLLTPIDGTLFRAPDRTIASHTLLTAADGRRVLSTGLQRYARTSLLKLTSLWASLIAGVLGLAYLLVSGLVRALARRMAPSHPVFVPLLRVVALLLPLPLFLRQSFLQLGDVTIASGLLAIVTMGLPLAMLAGLIIQLRRGRAGKIAIFDVLAMLALLQWTVVLAA